MAYYLVRAVPLSSNIGELRQRLDADEFQGMQPFGHALTHSLENARYDPGGGRAVWEEEDYCNPPLAMERDAVLDDYFREIEVERVEEDEGWSQIEDLPGLWEINTEELTQ